MTTVAPHHAARPPWTVRVATWSARHRWPVLVLWFVATLGLFAASLAMGGTDTEAAVSQDTSAKYESIRAYDAFGANAVSAPVGQSVYVVLSNPNQKVTDPAYAAAIADVVGQLKAATATLESGLQTVDWPATSSTSATTRADCSIRQSRYRLRSWRAARSSRHGAVPPKRPSVSRRGPAT